MSLRRHHPSLRLLLAPTLLLLTTTTSALPASFIFARADSCSSDYQACDGLPSGFCCPEDSNCIALAGNTTVICCPSYSDCEKIKPVTCDLDQYDVDSHPNATIKSTVSDVALETCGEQCCPYGYTCKNDSYCYMDSDQTKTPSELASSASASASASATATATSTGSSSGTADATTTGVSSATDEASTTDAAAGSSSENSKDNSGPKTTSIVGGVVGAFMCLLIVGVIIFCYIRRKKKSDAVRSEKSGAAYGHGRAPSSTGSFGNIISEPIAQPNSYRTDFILKSPSNSASNTTPASRSSPSRTSYSRASTLMRSASSIIRVHPTPPRIRISIPNPFNSPNPSPNHHSAQPSPVDNDEPPRHGTVRLAPIRAMRASSHCSRRPSTPELQREPSNESIQVFAEPGTVKSRPLTRGTTFTDLMDEADLGDVRRGTPYVPGTTPRL